MVPQRRLATLLDQARRYQAISCPFHAGGVTSLYVDHECKSGQFPSVTTHILADHTDEVWRVEWSPDGMMLASAGKDHQVVIWQLKVSFTTDVISKLIMRRRHPEQEAVYSIACRQYITYGITEILLMFWPGHRMEERSLLELRRACTFGIQRSAALRR